MSTCASDEVADSPAAGGRPHAYPATVPSTPPEPNRAVGEHAPSGSAAAQKRWPSGPTWASAAHTMSSGA